MISEILTSIIVINCIIAVFSFTNDFIITTKRMFLISLIPPFAYVIVIGTGILLIFAILFAGVFETWKENKW